MFDTDVVARGRQVFGDGQQTGLALRGTARNAFASLRVGGVVWVQQLALPVLPQAGVAAVLLCDGQVAGLGQVGGVRFGE
jgi:hypothetical protein